MMPAKEGGIKACYNVQTAVDAKSHMIADFNITDSPSDRGQLCKTMQMCMEDLELDTVKSIADKGYESPADIKDCLMNGIVPDVGFIQDREERVFPLDYVEREITPEMKASAKPEDIQACLHAGVLPDCYEGTNIRVEVQSLSNISCFIRHEDGTVTCPMGRQLFKQKDTKYGTEYSSRGACRTIKHYDDGRYFLCKGREKVTAEFALSALAYNIRRAINLCGGVQKLIDLFRRIAVPKIRKIAEI